MNDQDPTLNRPSASAAPAAVTKRRSPASLTPFALAAGLALLGAGFLTGYLVRANPQSGGSIAHMLSLPPTRYTKPSQPPAVPRPPSEPFVRLDLDGSGKPIALESAIVPYVPIDGSKLRVTLVGAVHIADQDYFENLNGLFSQFEIVLYELVAPQGTVPKFDGTRPKSAIAQLQYVLLDLLGLHHQLEGVNYASPNFVHADLSFDELVKLGAERGETALTFGAGVVLDMLRLMQRMKMRQEQGHAPVPQPSLGQLFAQPEHVREVFARSLADEGAGDLLAGLTTLAPYLIDARNAAALRMLDTAIAQGKTDIAIFYGAAHLPDFERRLFEEFGLVRQEGSWLRAWDLTKPIQRKDPFKLLMEILRG